MIILKTVIVDDEPDSVSLLKRQLIKHCPHVDVVGSYTDSEDALHGIELLKPDLLFLDVEMPVMNGFELLEKLAYPRLSVVFVTAYTQFALKAFRFNALDCLVKPVEIDELIEAVSKAESRVQPTAAQLEMLQKQLRGEPIKKIAVPDQHGVSFIDFDEIVLFEASNNYSKLTCKDKRFFIISKSLKEIQEVLEEDHFLRVHRQYIINLNHIKQFNRNSLELTMSTGENVPVARNQKEKLAEKFKWL